MQWIPTPNWKFAVSILAMSSAVTWACEITVRDSAFTTPRDNHRICIMARPKDVSASRMADRLATWLEGPGSSLNLELEKVNVDDPEIRWSTYGRQ